GEPTTLALEPHHLVVWAGRWYLVAFEPEADRWRAMRVDRLTPRMPTGRTFDRRPVPHGDPATFVMTTYDRGDTPAEWPCRGSALLALPASLVARFAPRRVDGRVRHRLHLPPHPRRVVVGRPGRAAADLRRGPRRDRAGRGRAGAARPARPHRQRDRAGRPLRTDRGAERHAPPSADVAGQGPTAPVGRGAPGCRGGRVTIDT